MQDRLGRGDDADGLVVCALDQHLPIDDQAVPTRFGRRPQEGHQRLLSSVASGPTTNTAAKYRGVNLDDDVSRVRAPVGTGSEEERLGAISGDCLVQGFDLDGDAH